MSKQMDSAERSRVAIKKWCEWLEHNRGRSPRTVTKYHQYLTMLSQWLESEQECTLLDATLEHLELYVGFEAHRRGIRPRSRQPLVSCLRGFYRWAAGQARAIESNPAAALPQPSIGKSLPRVMSLHSAEKIMMAPDLGTFVGIRDAAIMSVMLGCGMRVGGVSGINEWDLEWARPKDEALEELTIRTREKGGRERLVPAPHETALLLRAYLGHPDLAAIDRSIPNGNAVLFVAMTTGGSCKDHEHYGERRRLSPRAIHRIVQKYAKQVGVPMEQAHPHAMRHLYGTELEEGDTGLFQIQALMGHANTNSTKQYVHLASRKLREAALKNSPITKIYTPVSDLAKAMRDKEHT